MAFFKVGHYHLHVKDLIHISIVAHAEHPVTLALMRALADSYYSRGQFNLRCRCYFEKCANAKIK